MRTKLIAIGVLFFPLNIAAQQFNGTISSSGYTPPANVWVQWCRAGLDAECHSFQLDQSVSWNGQDRLTKFDRYSNGNESVDGWNMIPAMSSETQGGEIGAALLALYKKSGLGREYTKQELWDFGLANSCGQYVCGCSWYERVTGSRHPIDSGCVNESKSSADVGGLRPCPNEPIGCGRNRNNPCMTADTDIPTDKAKQVPCWSDKRVGRWLIRKEVIGGIIDQPAEPTKPVDSAQPTKPSDSIICLVLRIDSKTGATIVEQCKL